MVRRTVFYLLLFVGSLFLVGALGAASGGNWQLFAIYGLFALSATASAVFYALLVVGADAEERDEQFLWRDRARWPGGNDESP